MNPSTRENLLYFIPIVIAGLLYFPMSEGGIFARIISTAIMGFFVAGLGQFIGYMLTGLCDLFLGLDPNKAPMLRAAVLGTFSIMFVFSYAVYILYGVPSADQIVSCVEGDYADVESGFRTIEEVVKNCSTLSSHY